MPNATIVYERTVTVTVETEAGPTEQEQVITVDMANWPPTTWLVHLDEPLVRFDPETGAQTGFDYVALTCKDSEPRAAYVFPSDAEGNFVDPTMTPMRTRDYGLPHSVLAQLGFTVTN
jgi:hypothetical protein